MQIASAAIGGHRVNCSATHLVATFTENFAKVSPVIAPFDVFYNPPRSAPFYEHGASCASTAPTLTTSLSRSAALDGRGANGEFLERVLLPGRREARLRLRIRRPCGWSARVSTEDGICEAN